MKWFVAFVVNRPRRWSRLKLYDLQPTTTKPRVHFVSLYKFTTEAALCLTMEVGHFYSGDQGSLRWKPAEVDTDVDTTPNFRLAYHAYGFRHSLLRSILTSKYHESLYLQ
jgi:hypothetical protein